MRLLIPRPNWLAGVMSPVQALLDEKHNYIEHTDGAGPDTVQLSKREFDALRDELRGTGHLRHDTRYQEFQILGMRIVNDYGINADWEPPWANAVVENTMIANMAITANKVWPVAGIQPKPSRVLLLL